VRGARKKIVLKPGRQKVGKKKVAQANKTKKHLPEKMGSGRAAGGLSWRGKALERGRKGLPNDENGGETKYSLERSRVKQHQKGNLAGP